MPTGLIVAAVIGVLLLGVAVIPAFNRRQLQKMPPQQQVRILMKQAKGLHWFKNISSGSRGTLVYVKNKRKICKLPWVLDGSVMRCTNHSPFDYWDYPENGQPFTADEREQAQKALAEYNKNSLVKIVIKEKE